MRSRLMVFSGNKRQSRDISNRHRRNGKGENTALDWEVKTATLSLKQALRCRCVCKRLALDLGMRRWP